jgi:hypothetical protein
MVDIAVSSHDEIKEKVKVGLPIANELIGVKGDIIGGVDNVEALNYEKKRK